MSDMMSTTLALVLLGGILAMWWPSDSGILPAPSGEAVLIAGEACTVNMGANRPLTHIREDFEFCLGEHERIFFEGEGE